jgi:hypothetical protein
MLVVAVVSSLQLRLHLHLVFIYFLDEKIKIEQEILNTSWINGRVSTHGFSEP